MRTSLRCPVALMLAACSITATTPLSAQAPYMGRDPVPAVWLDLAYPTWDGIDGFTAFVFNAGGRLRIGKATVLVAEVPLVQASMDNTTENGFMIGNPYLGVRQEVGTVTAELGLRLPVVGDSAPQAAEAAGLYGDFDRGEAYLENLWSFRGDAEWETNVSNGLRLVAGAGVSLWTEEGQESEWWVNYRAGAGYVHPRAVLMAWFSGRWNATNENQDFGRASAHQLALSVTDAQGRFRPAAFIRIPLDEELDILKLVLGVGVTYGL